MTAPTYTVQLHGSIAQRTNPSTLPTGQANGVAWSRDGVYLAVAHATSPFVSIYKRDGNTLTKLSNPATLPAGIGYGVAWDKTGKYLAVAHATSPFVTVYSRSSDTFTKVADPATLPAGQGNGVAWANNGAYLAVAHNTSPFVTWYSFDGTNLNKLADPATLPASAGNRVSWPDNGSYLAVAHDTTPFVTVYSRSGNVLTKIADPATLPAGAGKDVDWTADGSNLAVAHTTTPFVTAYSRSGDVLTKLTNPTTLPTGNATGCAWTRVGDTFLAAVHAVSPFMTWYALDGSTLKKMGAASAAPGSTTTSVTIQPDAAGLEDTYTDNSQASTNYGSSADLGISGTSTEKKGWLKIVDLSSIPAEATISSAPLVLKAYSRVHRNNVRLAAFRAGASWVEGSITHNNLPSPETAGSQLDEIINPGAPPLDLSWDIAAAVQGWIDGSFSNDGVRLYGTLGNNTYACRSSDYGTASERPKLVVTYDEEIPRDVAWTEDGSHLAVARGYTPYLAWYSHDGFGDLDIASDVIARMTLGRGRDSARTLAPTIAGFSDLDLDNLANTYDPGNILRRGLPVQIKATWNGTTYSLFTGQIEDFIQHPEVDRREVSVESLGVFNKLVGKKVSTELYQNIRVDTAIGHVLDAVGWPTDDRTLDTADVTLDWWWLDDEDAFEAIRVLVNTEGPRAAAIEGGDGKFLFHNRLHVAEQAASNTIQATFRDSGASPRYTEPFEYDDGLQDVINEVVVTVKARSAKSPAIDIWTIGVAGTRITLAAGGTKTFLVRHTSGDPFTAAVTPSAGTDYTLIAGSLATVSLSRTSGGNSKLTLVAGGSGATVDDLKVRAQRVSVDSETQITNTVDASSSQNQHGVQTYPFKIRAEIPEDEARGFCNTIVGDYKDGRPTVMITVPNVDTTTLEAALAREIHDRIRVIEGNHSIDKEYWVQQVRHYVRTGLHEVVIHAEEVSTAIPLIWGTGKWGQGAWWH